MARLVFSRTPLLLLLGRVGPGAPLTAKDSRRSSQPTNLRYSQARANDHSRLTVAAEIPSDWPTSSIESPPKGLVGGFCFSAYCQRLAPNPGLRRYLPILPFREIRHTRFSFASKFSSFT
jgi:hypothetical protein